MDLEVGPFVIFFPSASSPGFSMHHDLAGVFGLDYNRDAVAALRTALRELDEAPKTGIDVDHEADAVFVEARSAVGMAKVLRAIERAAARPLFEPAELARACAAMRAWRRPRPLAYDLGAACSIALADGSVGAVVVAAFPDAIASFRGSPLLVVLDVRAASVDALGATLAGGRAVAGWVTLDTEIVSGAWPIVGVRAPASLDVDLDALVARERGTSGGPGPGEFLGCWFGLTPWDMRLDPLDNERRLLPGCAPPRRRLGREAFAARAPDAASPPASGPATLHVTLVYPGDGLPRPYDVGMKLKPLARAILPVATGGLGAPGGLRTGGGDGRFDIFLHVDDVEGARAAIEEAARALKLDRDVLVDAYPRFDFD